MKLKVMLNLTFVFVLALCGTMLAQEKTGGDKTHDQTQASTQASMDESRDMKDEIQQSQKSAKVFTEIMNISEKSIPQNILEKAECVAVFPDVLKAGFIVGGRGGRGVASCRMGDSWSAPVYLNLGGGSFGLQIGAQSTDFVILVMNKEGVGSLIKSKFVLGGDASVAAGPVGRQAGASTDIRMDAQILSYSRSKGLFAGLELKGVMIEVDKDDMRDAYGRDITAKEVLRENKVSAPAGIKAFPDTLAKYSTRIASKDTK
jgi:SH3 domain-containing YSC84-like protein 1